MSKGKQQTVPPILLALIMVIAIIVCLMLFVAVRLTLATSRGKTFYEGTTINSVDVSNLTAVEAAAKLNSMANSYQLTVNFADSAETVSGSEIELGVNQKNQIKKLLKEQNRINQSDVSSMDLELSDDTLWTYNEESISALVSSWGELTELSGQTPVNAKLTYSEKQGKFVIEPETVGGTVDADELTAAIEVQCMTLNDSLNVAENGLYGQEIRCADGEEMQQALTDANTKLNLRITYIYSVPSAEINGTEEIGYDLLSQWLFVEDDGVSIGVNSDQLQAYVSSMYDTYSVQDNSTSNFVTTGGNFIEVNVPASDETVDTDALFNDIVSCVDNMASEQRQAPYASTSIGIAGTTDLGGSYVEIDLDNQYLWLYKDKKVIAEGSICSGDVATGCSTPDGLYTIKSMETDRWLNGADYHDWVSYWMPFNGGIGLHDATWRSEDEFGGDVYLESGSHGCINMPLELAKQVFENVDVGSYVILYGGVASTVEQVQTITGTTNYTKTVGDGAFYLDARSTGDGYLSYASSNTNVVTVDEDGRVTIVGAGSATIKVTAQATDTYNRATKDVYITVRSSSYSDSESYGETGTTVTPTTPSSGSSNTSGQTSNTQKPSSSGGSSSDKNNQKPAESKPEDNKGDSSSSGSSSSGGDSSNGSSSSGSDSSGSGSSSGSDSSGGSDKEPSGGSSSGNDSSGGNQGGGSDNQGDDDKGGSDDSGNKESKNEE
jgi:hypothetical protein